MCEPRQISNQSDYKYVFGINLTRPNDPEFKLAQLIVFKNNTLLFDLRQTKRGRKSKNGICLQIREFFWMKKILLGNYKLSKLEHDQRIITIERNEENCIISVTKSNGISNTITLGKNELISMINYLVEFESNILEMSSKCGYEIDFKTFAYINEINE